jgi:hypothetical protein
MDSSTLRSPYVRRGPTPERVRIALRHWGGGARGEVWGGSRLLGRARLSSSDRSDGSCQRHDGELARLVVPQGDRAPPKLANEPPENSAPRGPSRHGPPVPAFRAPNVASETGGSGLHTQATLRATYGHTWPYATSAVTPNGTPERLGRSCLRCFRTADLADADPIRAYRQDDLHSTDPGASFVDAGRICQSCEPGTCGIRRRPRTARLLATRSRSVRSGSPDTRASACAHGRA